MTMAEEKPEAPGLLGEAVASDASAELERVRRERDEIQDRLLRIAADLDNLRKRARREAEASEVRLRAGLLRKILPIADNLERALEHAVDDDPVAVGVKLVGRLLASTLAEEGVTRFSPVGERFDPAWHDAIEQEETRELPPGMIVKVRSPGYRIGDQLLRAALVVVSKQPAEEKTEPTVH
jgi:molecular chaperone GrpE